MMLADYMFVITCLFFKGSGVESSDFIMYMHFIF